MSNIRDPYGGQGSPRRPRPLLIGLLAAAVITVLLVWMRYDPVVGGDVTWCPEPSTLVPTGQLDPETGEPGVACTVVNTDELSVAFAATVRNGGLLPVVVRGVRMRGEIQEVLRVETVRVALRDGAEDVTSRELVEFSTFRLGPGEQRLVEVRGTLVPCEEVARPRVATFTSVPLRITVLGLPHDSSAALRPPVRLIAETC